MLIDSILDIGSKIIERVFPNPAERDKATYELLKLQQDGQFKEIELQMNAIVAEAKSEDKWTSRARPSFLYVMYIMILAAIPMGIIYAINPILAAHISDGLRAWLSAIPDALWGMFGAGYLGYVGSRSYDKKQILSAKK